MRFRIAAFSLLISLVGCSSLGSKSEKKALDGAGAAKSVVVCQSHLAEIIALLGTPSRDGILRTSRVVSWITATEPLVQYLAVLVNEREIITDLYWNIPTEVAWTPEDQCAHRLQP